MNYTFSDLIEVPKVQRLNDLFYTATGIPGAVIDLKGTIVTCSGWQEVCTKFHRVNEETVQRCIESDTVFANQIGVGQKYTVYTCGNGLVVAASPIAIGGQHVANFITSQYLFHPPDRDFFLEQARRFGFDETAYMEAVGKIPIVDESKLQTFLEYFSEFAAMLGEIGLKQLRQLEAAAALRESEQRWATTLSSIGDAVIATDTQGRITYMNAVAEGLTGWTLTEAAAKPVTDVFNIINERTRKAVDIPVTKVLQKGMIVGLANHTVLVSRDGREIPIDDSAAPIRDAAGNTIGVVLVFRDITERKAAEEALRENQTQMSRAQEIAHLGSWELDLMNNHLSWSDEVYRIFGLQPQKFGATYDAFLEAVHPDDRAAVDTAYTASLREGRDTYEIEHRVVRRSSGEIRVVHEKCEHFRDETGRIVKSVGMVHDITERKRAEQELREARAELERKVAERTAELRRSEAYLAEGQRLSHTGSFGSDPKSRDPLYWSEEMFRIFGFDPHEPLPTWEAWTGRIHPQDWNKVEESFQKTLREKVDTYDEYRITMPDGTIKHIHAIRHPVLNSAGEVIRLVGTSMDITERKRAEEALRLAGIYNRSLIEASLDPLVTIDPEGRISDVNAATEQATGYTRSELIGTDISEYFTEPEKARSVHRQVFSQGLMRDYELEILHRDGKITPVLCNASVYRDEAGKVIGIFAAARDITERKETLRFFQNMDRINRAMQGTNDLEQMMSDVLDAMLSIFESDRAFLVYPCDPDAPSFEIAMERTRPGYPVRRGVILTADTAKHFQLYLASSGAVTLGPGCDYPLEISRFGEKSKIMIALYPKTGKPWILGTHQCSYPRVWSEGEKKLLEEIARRISDVLTSLLAHRDLHESEERHRVTLQTAMDGFLLTDMQGRILEVNETYCRMSGYSEQELLTMQVADLSPALTADTVAVLIKGLVEVGPNRFEIVGRRKDGSLVDAEVSAHYQPVAGGQLVIFVRDITERKRAEAEINSLKNYLSNIIDSMPSILVGMDNTRTVTQWNLQAEAFTGIPAGEAIGKPIVHLFPDFAPWIMTMGTDMDEHRPSSMEKLLIEKEGERRFYDLMLYPLLTDAVGGAVLRIEDVTERARIQELMVQTEKMMSIGGLAAGMAHEINNPLGIITQAAQNIERRISLELHENRKVSEELGLNLEGMRAYFDKRQISDAIASIRTASSRAAKIVANMLQFSRRADTTMEFASLAQILDQALELAASDYDLKKKYDFRSIDIIKDYQDMPQVRIVSVEIEQVILNLLRNAAQAMIANPPDRRPSIALRLGCEARYAVLEVEDNGPGMTEDIRRRVFEPFFTTKEPGVGTGLGLSVSYMIVTQNHKGLMEVQSTPGRGTLFKVRLPIGGSNHE